MARDKFLQFLREMQDSEDYIKIANLKDNHSYKIYARNAYVGVWNKNNKGFLISRYKAGSNPYLFYESHWDIGEPGGTVKPLALIEKCPFTIQENHIDRNNIEFLNYLNRLEEDNPIFDDINLLQERKHAAMAFERRLVGNQEKQNKIKIPIHKIAHSFKK